MTQATMDRGPRIALVSGFWGQNIGNAFFNIGGKWVLQEAFPDASVEFIQDQPGYRTFHRQRTGNPRNDILLLKELVTDVIVLQGPMLTTTFSALWEDTFAALTARGTKIVLLSAAMFRYTQDEIDSNKKFLAKYPPALMVTRDHDSYEAFKDDVPLIHDGIDSAFFAPKAYTPFDLKLPPYVTVNFDRYPEPDFRVGDHAQRQPGDRSFEALGMKWLASPPPRLQTRLSDAGQWQAYIGALLDRRKLPLRFGDYLVVRAEHRFNPHITWKIYKHPQSIASDEPFTYFTLYNGTSLTLSDRVHACVATLAFGNPAMLFAPTPRSALFDRLGLGDIQERPVSLDLEYLEDERNAEIDFLRRHAAVLSASPDALESGVKSAA